MSDILGRAHENESNKKPLNLLFVKVDAVVMLTTSVTTTTRMLAVLADTTVTKGHFALQIRDRLVKPKDKIKNE